MSLEALMDAVDAMPMMADYVLVQVDDYNPYAQDADTRQALISLFSDLPDTCCLVFNFDTVKFSYGAEKEENEEQKEKKNDKTKKLLKECIEEYGVQVEFYKQSPAELAEWVARHFRALEKTVTPDLCQYLVFITGGSMTTLHSEIGKIAAYS
jgi:DNA polymerase-3 subunit delta